MANRAREGKLAARVAVMAVNLKEEAARAKERKTALVKKSKEMALEVKRMYRKPATSLNTAEAPMRRPTRPAPIARQIAPLPRALPVPEPAHLTPPGTPPRPPTPGHDIDLDSLEAPRVTQDIIGGMRVLRLGTHIILGVRARLGEAEVSMNTTSPDPENVPVKDPIEKADQERPTQAALAAEVRRYPNRHEWPETLRKQLQALRPHGYPPGKRCRVRLVDAAGQSFRVALP